MFGEQRIDPGLRQGVAALRLADIDAVRLRMGEVEDSGADQPVVNDNLGRPQCSQRPHGQQVRIARAGADEGDAAGRSRPAQPVWGRR
jgi:hypothetical protein